MLTHIATKIKTILPMKNGTTKAAEYPIVRIKNAIVRIFVFIGIPLPSCQFLMYSPNHRLVRSQLYTAPNFWHSTQRQAGETEWSAGAAE